MTGGLLLMTYGLNFSRRFVAAFGLIVGALIVGCGR